MEMEEIEEILKESAGERGEFINSNFQANGGGVAIGLGLLAIAKQLGRLANIYEQQIRIYARH